MENKNPWDVMSGYFDTSKVIDEIESGAADNILIAWPVILQFLHGNLPHIDRQRVLEFGCGGGGFAYKLDTLGFDVTGVDYSQEMIRTAKKVYGTDIPFLVGQSNKIKTLGTFNSITSIMTLQFIKDLEKTINDFSKALPTGGLLIFAVFNPDYVIEGLHNKRGFSVFDSDSNPKKGMKLFDGGKVRIPVYIRSAEEYNSLASKYGFKNLLESYPPFTEEFVTKYPDYQGIRFSEYLILGYKKE